MVRRMYGPEGFTRIPEVQAILNPLEQAACAAHLEAEYAGVIVERMVDMDDEGNITWEREDGALSGRDGGLARFEGLTPEALGDLLALLPAGQALERQNCAPSLAEMAALAERIPGMRFNGYRVSDEREDERISLEGFDVPAEHAGTVLAMLHTLPDEWYALSHDGQAYFRAWWD